MTQIVLRPTHCQTEGDSEIQRERINYFRMAMQAKLKDVDSWLRNRLRYCIWEDWKKPDRRLKNLIRLAISTSQAYAWSRTRNERSGSCPKSHACSHDHIGKTGKTRTRIFILLLRKSISTI
ncbi:MAG: group II intron maturase-specific domain-containing protein [Bacteroidota bacterium]